MIKNKILARINSRVAGLFFIATGILIFLGFIVFFLLNKNINENYLNFTNQEILDNKNELVVANYKKAYIANPLNRDVVHDYVDGLLYLAKNEEAYNVIENYIKNTPKDNYWDDVDIWIYRAEAALFTNRCVEAYTSGYHASMRTLPNTEERKLADGITSNAMNRSANKDGKCVDESK